MDGDWFVLVSWLVVFVVNYIGRSWWKGGRCLSKEEEEEEINLLIFSWAAE